MGVGDKVQETVFYFDVHNGRSSVILSSLCGLFFLFSYFFDISRDIMFWHKKLFWLLEFENREKTKLNL